MASLTSPPCRNCTDPEECETTGCAVRGGPVKRRVVSDCPGEARCDGPDVCGDWDSHAVPDTALPTDSQERKDIPLARGLLDYFPAALTEVARLSRVGNEKHNPGEELHHARGKSTDHADCILRHLIERGLEDTDGLSHTVKVAWRALALLQEELEEQGAPLARGAKLP